VSERRALETPLELSGGGRALFTTRASGNLSTRVGEGAQIATRARERLRQRLELRTLAHSRQVHGATVRSLPAGSARERPASDQGSEADGLLTASGGLGLMALSADCLPVALGADGAVAMLHAGWRGLAAGVLEEGVRSLRRKTAGQEIVAIIGPGAGPCCYEVGSEVHAAFGDARRNGFLDLKGIASERLRAAGVADVRDLGLCTICDRRFFSHRREGARAGRQAGLAWRL
jgi:polyphenol oxidase